MSKLTDDLQGRYVGVDDNPDYDQELSTVNSDKLKTCILCGKPFIKNGRAVYCNRQHYTTCVNCGKRLDITKIYFRGGFVPKTCSKVCADIVGAKALKDNCLKKYGVTNPMYVKEFSDKAFIKSHPDLDISMRKAMEIRKCQICGKEFTVYRTDPKKCCSVTCASKLREQHVSEHIRLCKLCGKPFAPKFGKSLYCDGPHYRDCIICGKSFELKSLDSVTQTCSMECQGKLSRQTNLRKYGVEVGSQSQQAKDKLRDVYYKNNPDQIKQDVSKDKSKICILCGKPFIPTANAQKVCNDVHYRNCEVCGKSFVITKPSDSQRCCSKECTVKKRQNTITERFGVPNALQNPELLEKAQQTTFTHYGVKHAMQSDVIADKVSKIFLDKYGVPTPFLMTDFNEKAKRTTVEKYGKEYVVPLTISKTNKSIAAEIETITGYKCELDQIKLDRYSYDIHIIDTNILIEIDPTYTHNVIGNHWHHSGISSDYHLSKTNTATSNGYRCIHIFDWDDLSKVIHLIAPKKTLYARKCEIRSVSSKVANAFEQDNHLQNSCRGQTVRLGLYYEDDLVQVMTFGKPRYNKSYAWELLRLCTRSDLQIVGGAERLFAHFIKEYSPESIISYCDLSKFTGEVYLRLGFTLHNITKPNKVWSKRKHAITNNLLVARGYDQLFGTSYGKGTSNEQLMLDNGWYPVYDCGQAVYVWMR